MVYLLHYDTAIGGPRHTAQHYMGFTDDPVRIEQHAAGTSNHARLPRVFFELGIKFVVARTWEGDRKLERKLKKRHNHRKICPVCTPGTA